MEKRLFIAIVLSIAFLLGWAALAPRFFPDLAKKPAVAESAAPATSETASPATGDAAGTVAASPASPGAPGSVAGTSRTASPIAVPATSATATLVTVDTPNYVARFTNRGAQLISFELKNYDNLATAENVDLVKQRPAGRLDYPFALETSDRAFTRAANESLYAVDNRLASSRTLRFSWSDGSGRSVQKTFVFTDDYVFDFEIVAQGASGLQYRTMIGPGIRTVDPSAKDDQFTITGNAVHGTAAEREIITRDDAAKFQLLEETPLYVGIEDNYFLTALLPKRSEGSLFRSTTFPTGKDNEVRKEVYAGINASSGIASGRAYFGPKDVSILEKHGLSSAVDFGFFGFIARILLTALIYLFGLTKNWGWAIVVLTIIIKILLYPLQHKSIVSMKKMQKVQPKMQAIREKYKKAKTDHDQRQKMNMEMMKLYQTEGINPASGCLPILLQLPILWAFYGLLSHAIELRGADFMLWINDLSAKDPYYVTPILMTLTMFIQQYITPMSVEPAQRKMFLAMPFIFGFFFKDFPSGLVLYWLVQNILSIVQQLIMNKWWKDHPAELAKA
jgi:YidC/Oxa1 family membrane protein insertase